MHARNLTRTVTPVRGDRSEHTRERTQRAHAMHPGSQGKARERSIVPKITAALLPFSAVMTTTPVCACLSAQTHRTARVIVHDAVDVGVGWSSRVMCCDPDVSEEEGVDVQWCGTGCTVGRVGGEWSRRRRGSE